MCQLWCCVAQFTVFIWPYCILNSVCIIYCCKYFLYEKNQTKLRNKTEICIFQHLYVSRHRWNQNAKRDILFYPSCICISYVEVHLCKFCGSQWTITLNLEFSRFPFHTILTDKRIFYLFLVKKLLTSLSVFSPFFFAFPSECFFALVFLLTLQERMQLLQSAHTWNTYTFYVRIFFGFYILVWHMYYR